MTETNMEHSGGNKKEEMGEQIKKKRISMVEWSVKILQV